MRPVKLTMKGLRSYRSKTIVDFSDVNLLAIMGDTGAGKSSILEGICAALYGTCTWDGKNFKSLISDGMPTVQLELEFAVRDVTYIVERSTSRGTYPAPLHKLRCRATGEQVDGEAAVTQRVEELVGLTREEFLRAVILPQNRFQQLLTATPVERDRVLVGIFGLDVLDAVRERADQGARDLSEPLCSAEMARVRLFPDPAAVADEAGVTLAEAESAAEKLDAVLARVRALTGMTEALTRAAPTADNALAGLHRIDWDAVLGALSAADDAAAHLDARQAQLDDEISRAATRRDKAQGVLAAAADGGEDVVTLTAAATTLKQVCEDLPNLLEDAAVRQRDREHLRSLESRLKELTGERDDAGKLAGQAAEALPELREAAEQAAGRLRDQHARLDELARLLAAVPHATARVEEHAAALDDAEDAVEQARSDVDAAEREVQARDDELRELLARDAAATASRGHHPGDPCPVCRRTLPDDFTELPPVPGEQKASTALAAAKVAATARRDDLASREREAGTKRTELARHHTALDQLVRAVREQAQHVPALARRMTPCAAGFAEPDLLVASITAPIAGLLGADFVVERDSLLEVASSDQRAARRRLDGAEQRHRELADEAARLDGEVSSRTREFQRERMQVAARAQTLTRRATDILADIARLPALVSSGAQAALGDDPEQLLAMSAAPIGQLRGIIEKVRGRLQELQAADEQYRAASDAVATIETDRRKLSEQRAREVDRPRGAARTTLTEAAGAVSKLQALWPALRIAGEQATALDQSLPPMDPLPELALPDWQQVDAAELTVAGHTARTAVDELAAAAAAGLQQASSVADGAASLATAALQAADAADQQDMAQLCRQAAARVQTLRDLQQRARRQAPVTRELDERIGELSRQVSVLSAVKDLLSRNAFVRYVVASRQQALLRVASLIVGDLTRGRYGFAADFRIVDRRTSQPRKVQTLSGGETFLASLALALALVEISARGGGQLDALFLDEGFGSLDATALGEALDVLRSHANKGRLVTVVSHLQAVAAELDDVLLVERTAEGSHLHWLEAAERERLLIGEVSGGLLT